MSHRLSRNVSRLSVSMSCTRLNASRKRPRPYYDLNQLGVASWRRLQLEFIVVFSRCGSGGRLTRAFVSRRKF